MIVVTVLGVVITSQSNDLKTKVINNERFLELLFVDTFELIPLDRQVFT